MNNSIPNFTSKKEHVVYLYNNIATYFQDQLNYYSRYKKFGKWARTLRYTSLLVLGIGSVCPLIELFFLQNNSIIPIELLTKLNLSALGFLFITIAGGLIIFDRVSGISNTYIRYVNVYLRIYIFLDDFKVNFSKKVVGIDFNDTSSDMEDTEYNKIVKCLNQYKDHVDELITKETESWKEQFMQSGESLVSLVKKHQLVVKKNDNVST